MHRLILLIATLCLLWGNPVSAQISGGGGGGGAGDASAANQVTEHGYIGATTDAAATAGSTGSLSAKLRLLTSDLDAIKTSIQLLDDAIHASDAALSKVLAAGCQFDDTTPGTTTEDSVRAVRCSTRREIYEVIRDAAGNERGANVNASNELLVALSSVPSHAVTNAGTFATQAAQSGTWNITNVSGTVSLPTGASTAAKQPALGTAGTASADVITVQGIASMTALKVDGSAVTQPVSGTFWQATQPVSGTVTANQGGTWTVQPGNTANTTPWLVTPTPSTSGGLAAPCRTISAATTNATSCKASAGQLYGWSFSNTNAEERYLKVYNKASAPTVGTDTPIQTILIPGATTGAGNNWTSAHGIPYGTGIAYAITTGPTDADTGAVAANEIIVHLYYK